MRNMIPVSVAGALALLALTAWSGLAAEDMVLIPAGEFRLGCAASDPDCRGQEMPAVDVFVDDFQIDRFEVTQGEYRAVMGENPSYFSDCGDLCPVEQVTWYQAGAYCAAVDKRLPTEAEWQKAARARAGTRYYWGDDMDGDYAWHSGNSGGRTHSVGLKKPNDYGLRDMAGNVAEWVEDLYERRWYQTLEPGVRNPVNLSTARFYRVALGGSWLSLPWRLRISNRYYYFAAAAYRDIGFRCARD